MPNQQSIRRAQGSCCVQVLQGGYPHLPVVCNLKLAEAGCGVVVQQQACISVSEAAAGIGGLACHDRKGVSDCWVHTEMCVGWQTRPRSDVHSCQPYGNSRGCLGASYLMADAA